MSIKQGISWRNGMASCGFFQFPYSQRAEVVALHLKEGQKLMAYCKYRSLWGF
ncbi:MAG: hypothetical protein ACK551_06065 [Vampirovibrionales bacterium]